MDESAKLGIVYEINAGDGNALPRYLYAGPYQAEVAMALTDLHHDDSRPPRCFIKCPHARRESYQLFENLAISHRSDYGSKCHIRETPRHTHRFAELFPVLRERFGDLADGREDFRVLPLNLMHSRQKLDSPPVRLLIIPYG